MTTYAILSLPPHCRVILMMTETMTADKMTAKADKMMTDKMTVDVASVDVVDVRFDIMAAAMGMGRTR